MAGLGVLFFIGLYLFIAYKIVKATKTTRAKWLAIIILILIPTADEIAGRIYLQYLCETEGGLKVHRVAQGVEGFMSDGSEDILAVEKYGYKFSESRPLNGRVNRYAKVNGQVVKENDVMPKSKFRVRFLKENDKGAYTRTTLSVETFPDGEVLAADTQIGFNGGWVVRLLASFGGTNPIWCDYKDLTVRRNEITSNSLKR